MSAPDYLQLALELDEDMTREQYMLEFDKIRSQWCLVFEIDAYAYRSETFAISVGTYCKASRLLEALVAMRKTSISDSVWPDDPDKDYHEDLWLQHVRIESEHSVAQIQGCIRLELHSREEHDAVRILAKVLAALQRNEKELNTARGYSPHGPDWVAYFVERRDYFVDDDAFPTEARDARAVAEFEKCIGERL